MTWEQVLAYLDARPPRGERRGLERMRALMHGLGDPQAQVSFVHIAGTSGKGSTAAFTESILRACGYRTGLFLSPHVYDFRERIQLGGEMASPELLAQVFTEMRPALDRFDAAGDPCAYFEVLTALALCTFARAGVQVGVLEVGIGGLLDSTNVIPPPLAAAVCAISLEHTNILGSTLSEIAAQKCGILKPGTRAAGYCDLAPEARAVLEETCRREKIPLHVADPSRLTIERETGHGSEFTYAGETWRVSLAGRHQVYNALTALMLVRCLREGGLALPDAGVARGLEQASLAGRMEIVREDPICILDGAHNPGKMAALMSSLAELYPGRSRITLMGIMERKAHAACTALAARGSRVFIAVPAEEGTDLSLPTAQLAQEAMPFCPGVYCCPTAREGARLARSLAGKDEIILACGSMYLLEEAKKGFLDPI